MQRIRAVERAWCQGKRFLTFGSSRKIGLRRKTRSFRAFLRIDEGVGVARADHAPAVLRAAEQVRAPGANAHALRVSDETSHDSALGLTAALAAQMTLLRIELEQLRARENEARKTNEFLVA